MAVYSSVTPLLLLLLLCDQSVVTELFVTPQTEACLVPSVHGISQVRTHLGYRVFSFLFFFFKSIF